MIERAHAQLDALVGNVARLIAVRADSQSTAIAQTIDEAEATKPREETTMADDPNIRGQQDRSRINVDQAHELRYWSDKFGVTEQQLRDAVDAVGPMVDDVEKRIRGSHGRGTR